jgi:glutamate dehydrogenase (NAD(P)+)
MPTRLSGHDLAVQIHRLESTDGFIAYDLGDAPAAGIVRCAPKILVDGASLLTRTLTYRFASFERQVGGASAGVNAKPDQRAEALASFDTEVAPAVVGGKVCLDAARGVADDDLPAVRGADPRPQDYWTRREELAAVGIVAAASAAIGGLEGRSVAIEGFDAAGPALVQQLGAAGARIVAVSTPAGTVAESTGIRADEVADAWSSGGADAVAALAGAAGPADAVFGVDADVLVVGSKAGVVDHDVAAELGARLVVPSGPVPVTAKALAVLRRRDVVVLPDFVSTAGPLFAGWPDPGGAVDPADGARRGITAVLAEVAEHPDGPLLAACYRAEAFLATWRDELPFGRPLA